MYERIWDAFAGLSDNGITVRADRLGYLGIEYRPSVVLASAFYSAIDEIREIDPGQTVLVRRSRVDLTEVRALFVEMVHGQEAVSIDVSDNAIEGSLWALTGAHRLVASRLLGNPIAARIWRG